MRNRAFLVIMEGRATTCSINRSLNESGPLDKSGGYIAVALREYANIVFRKGDTSWLMRKKASLLIGQ